jgi:hypothetical protein
MAIRQPSRPIAPSGGEWAAYHGQPRSEAEYLALDDAQHTNLEYYDGAAWEKGMVDRTHRVLTGDLTGPLLVLCATGRW